MSDTRTRRRTSAPADAALIAAVVVAGSVSRHAVYTWYGVLLLAVCVLVLAAAAWAGAAPDFVYWLMLPSSAFMYLKASSSPSICTIVARKV